MSQDAFRALLSRPATQAAPASRSSAPAAQAPAAAKARRTFKPHKVTSSSSTGAAGASGAPAFRDRARERREDPKSTAVEEEISLYTRVGYDESKHLGGDLSRTHLVKGLDYLLLEKLRRGEGGEEGDGYGDADAALEAALESGGGNGGEQDQDGSTHHHHPEESLGAWAAGIVAVALTVHSAKADKKSDVVPTTLPPLVEQLARLRVEQRKPGRFAYGCLTYAFPLDTGLDDWEPPLSLWSSSSGGSRSGGGQLLLPGTLDDALYNTVVSTLHPRGSGSRPSLRTIASAPSTAATAAAGKVANAPALSTSRPSPPSASASAPIKPALKVAMAGALPLQPLPQPVKKVGFEGEKEVAKPKDVKEEEKAEAEEDDEEDIFGGVGKYVPPEASVSSSSSSAAPPDSNAPLPQKASTYRPLPPVHLRLVQTSTTTPLEESLLDEWDAVEKSETIAEERARLEAEARLEASKAAQAAMASKGGGGGAMAGAAAAKDTLKGGIGGGIQEGDALGSYEVQGWENPKEGAYKSEAWGVGGGQEEEEEEEEELEAGVRRGGGGGKKSAPAPPAAFKRGRGDNTTDFSELGGASWKGGGGGAGGGAGGAPSQRGHKSLRVDEWSAGAATRGGEGFESEKERKRKEAEAQNRLAQLIDLKKRTG